MKIKCPLCGCENYFTGLKDKGTKSCSNCNTPLVEPKIPDTTENLYIKIEKEKPNTTFLAPKKTLDKESFSNGLVDWVVESLKIRKNGFFQGFLKDIVEFGADKVIEEKFVEEIYYFYIWLAYINSISIFQNKNKINDYFSRFYKKMYGLVFKRKYGGYKEAEWTEILTQKLNGYIDAYNLLVKENPYFSKTSLGREFCKNLYGREGFSAVTMRIFTIFVTEELKASFESLSKGLTRYKI